MASFSSRWRERDGISHETEVLLETENGEDSNKRRPLVVPSKRKKWLFAACLSAFLMCGLVGAFYFVAYPDSKPGHDPYVFQSAAVAADTQMCSSVGSAILAHGGNAVDATIATLLCGGLASPQSMGIGGGFFMTIFNSTTKSSTIIDARETAPSKASEEMFQSDPSASSKGPLSIAVPGEIRGHWLAHQKFGSLSWRELFEPTIKLAADGYPVPIGLGRAIQDSQALLSSDTQFRSVFFNKETGQLYREGEIMKMTRLSATLRIIADEGAEAYYNGSLTDSILKDLGDTGSIITRDDLLDYKVEEKVPVEIVLHSGEKVISPPSPSGGPVLAFILNIIDGYYLSSDDVLTDERKTLTYHRIIEAFKFAYAKRTDLGDGAFVDVKELVKNLTSRAYADEIRSHITDNMTHDTKYYGPTFYDHVTPGTSHLSVVDQHGNAVSVTSTINGRFGSTLMGSRTGIIFNNEMDDFSSPNITNIYGIVPSPANFIRPGKRPLSSMCPSVMVDAKDKVIGVYGAAGGSMITTATAWVIAHARWLGFNIREAVEIPRLHHQLLPPYVQYEESFDNKIVLQGLKAKGHAEKSFKVGRSIVQSIQACNGLICAYSDPRKGGIPDGF